jgi:CBS domain-containing protein
MQHFHQTLGSLTKSQNLIVVNWMERLENAYARMLTIGVRHLPVVDDGGVIVGIMSDKDFFRAMQIDQPSFVSGKVAQPSFDPTSMVRDFMSWPVESIDEEGSVAEAAKKMVDKKISALLVSRDSEVLGIVTSEDLLRILASEAEKSLSHFTSDLTSTIYASPIGTLVQKLADIGL